MTTSHHPRHPRAAFHAPVPYPLLTTLLALLVAADNRGQTQMNWSQVATPGSPVARNDHGMCCDSVRGRIVMFGGSGQQGALGDTWEFDGAAWAQVGIPGPSSRQGHAMVFDSARGRTVLFGGSTGGAETWEYNGLSWTQVVTANSPSARSGHRMVFDVARNRSVLFGGSSGGGQTWEFDGIDWYAVFAATAPSARTGHAMAYDIARGRTVLFGGGNYPWLSDTWEYNGISWSLVQTVGAPAGRFGHVAAYDQVRGKVIIYGGRSLYPGGTTWPTDTWEYDGQTWSDVTNGTGNPGQRQYYGLAFHSSLGVTFMFGGFDYYGNFSQTWRLAQYTLPYPSLAITYGSGCGVPPLGFVPDPSTPPIIGQAGGAVVVNPPTPIVGAAMGWSDQTFGAFSLPVTLGGIGMTGCYLLQSNEVFGLGTASVSGTIRFDYPIPMQVGLLNADVYLQAYAFAPGANQLQVTISNGLRWRIGNQ